MKRATAWTSPAIMVSPKTTVPQPKTGSHPTKALALAEAQPRPAAREDPPTRPDALDHFFGLALTVLRRLFSGDNRGNPGAVHLFHAQQVAVDAHLVAGLWGGSQAAGDEAAHGLKVLALKLRSALFASSIGVPPCME